MDSIDGVTKSCLKTFELFKNQELNEEVMYKKLADLMQYNQAGSLLISTKKSLSDQERK